MKTKILYVLLITLLLSNMVLLFLLINKPHHRPPNRFLFKELNLNKAQLKNAVIYEHEHHQKMRQIDSDMKQLKDLFFKSISDETNTINSDSIADIIGINASKKDKEVLSYFKKVRNLCNENQKNKLDKIILKALPKHHKKGPPRRN